MKIGTLKVPGYHVGDCRELLRQLPDASVHTCVTSPPYWSLRDYGVEPLVWGGDPACEHRWGEALRMHKGGPHGPGVLVDGGRGVVAAQAAVKNIACGAFCETCGAWRGQMGLEPTPELFVDHMVEVFREVWRVLRPDGTLWMNLGDSYAASTTSDHGRGVATPALNGHGQAQVRGGWENPARKPPPPGLKPKDLVGIPWRAAFALQADGWWLRSDVVWAKPNPMPESVTDRPTRSHEYLFLLSKSDRYYYDADAISEDGMGRASGRRGYDKAGTFRIRTGFAKTGDVQWHKRNKRSVWTIPTEPTKDAHFATFPRKLVEPCVLAGAPVGGVVLDPFGGSGTVGRVAEDHGRRWVLFDLNPAYAKIAKRRTAQTGLLGRTAPAADGSAA